MNIFLSISFNICFGCSQEHSHSDAFEYQQQDCLFKTGLLSTHKIYDLLFDILLAGGQSFKVINPLTTEPE